MRTLLAPIDVSECLPFPVVAIGVFDGVHIGHQQIVRSVSTRARERNGRSVILTFDPHPQKVIGNSPPLLQTLEQRIEVLEVLGIDVLVICPFTRRLSLLTPEDFVGEVLLTLGAREVHVGTNFRFGHRRSGDFHELERLGARHGFGVFATEAVAFRGERVSSTRVRNAVVEGRVELVSRLLGRPYQIRGTVVRGSGNGLEFGYPTANLQVENELIPGKGVYVSRVRVNGEGFVGATNIGLRPTVERHLPTRPIVETHLLDFEGDLYGKQMSLDLCFRVRDEKKFDSVEQLKARIASDVRKAREYAGKIRRYREVEEWK